MIQLSIFEQISFYQFQDSGYFFNLKPLFNSILRQSIMRCWTDQQNDAAIHPSTAFRNVSRYFYKVFDFSVQILTVWLNRTTWEKKLAVSTIGIRLQILTYLLVLKNVKLVSQNIYLKSSFWVDSPFLRDLGLGREVISWAPAWQYIAFRSAYSDYHF